MSDTPQPIADMAKSPTIHQLKTWPAYFEAVLSGAKTFEVRKADRPFAVGDRLELQEFVPGIDGGYTGREHDCDVTYILPGGDFGLAPDVVVMGLSTPPIGAGSGVVVSDEMVNEAMLDAWNEICDDTGCHPQDIEQIGRKRLQFQPRHWSDLTAMRLRTLLADKAEAPEKDAKS